MMLLNGNKKFDQFPLIPSFSYFYYQLINFHFQAKERKREILRLKEDLKVAEG